MQAENKAENSQPRMSPPVGMLGERKIPDLIGHVGHRRVPTQASASWVEACLVDSRQSDAGTRCILQWPGLDCQSNTLLVE